MKVERKVNYFRVEIKRKGVDYVLEGLVVNNCRKDPERCGDIENNKCIISVDEKIPFCGVRVKRLESVLRRNNRISWRWLAGRGWEFNKKEAINIAS